MVGFFLPSCFCSNKKKETMRVKLSFFCSGSGTLFQNETTEFPRSEWAVGASVCRPQQESKFSYNIGLEADPDEKTSSVVLPSRHCPFHSNVPTNSWRYL